MLLRSESSSLQLIFVDLHLDHHGVNDIWIGVSTCRFTTHREITQLKDESINQCVFISTLELGRDDNLLEIGVGTLSRIWTIQKQKSQGICADRTWCFQKRQAMATVQSATPRASVDTSSKWICGTGKS